MTGFKTLFLFILLFFSNVQILGENFTANKVKTTISVLSQYVNHAPISINGNTEFREKAAAENWTGDGTESSPYLIEGLNIVGTGTYLIIIRNTSLFFQIFNNRLTGADESSIVFVNVT